MLTGTATQCNQSLNTLHMEGEGSTGGGLICKGKCTQLSVFRQVPSRLKAAAPGRTRKVRCAGSRNYVRIFELRCRKRLRSHCLGPAGKHDAVSGGLARPDVVSTSGPSIPLRLTPSVSSLTFTRCKMQPSLQVACAKACETSCKASRGHQNEELWKQHFSHDPVCNGLATCQAVADLQAPVVVLEGARLGDPWQPQTQQVGQVADDILPRPQSRAYTAKIKRPSGRSRETFRSGAAPWR